jgi:hypothetical protein
MRWINEQAISQAPFPRLTADQKIQMVNLGRAAEETRDGDSLAAIFDRIDNIIFDAFGLNGDARRQIVQYMDSRPGVPPRTPVATDEVNPPRPDFQPWVVTGEILGVDIPQQRMRIWLRGITDDAGQEIAVPSSVPGWALEPGVAFEATLNRPDRHGVVSLGTIQSWRRLDYGFATDDELDHLLKDQRNLLSLYRD